MHNRIIILFSLLIIQSVIFASTNGWTSNPSHSTDFSEPSNWSLGHPPTPGEDVVIPTTPIHGAFFPVVDVEGIVIKSLTIEAGASLNSNGFDLSVLGNISGGGTLVTDGSNINVSGNLDIATLLADGSTINFDGPPIQFSNPYTFHNLIINSEVTITGAANIEGFLTINGVLNLGPFEYDLDGSITGQGILLAGPGSTLKISNNMSLTGFGANTSTVIFDGDQEQTIGHFEFYNLQITNPTTVNFSEGGLVGKDLTINNGMMVVAAFKIFGCDGDVSGNGSLEVGENSTMGFGGNMSMDNFILGSGSTVEYYGNQFQEINPTTFYNLSTGNTSLEGIVLTGNTMVNGDLTIYDGYLDTDDHNLTVSGDVGGGAELRAGEDNTITIGGDMSVSTFTAETSTVILNGSESQDITPPYTFNHLSSSNTSGLGVEIKQNTTVNGNFLINSSSFQVNDNKMLTVKGSISGNGRLDLRPGTTVNLQGDLLVGSILNAASNDILINMNGTAPQQINSYTIKRLDIDNTAGVSMNGGITVEDGLNIKTGKLITNNSALVVYGDVYGSGTLEGGSSNLISIDGDMTIENFVANSSTVDFFGIEQQVINSYTFNSVDIRNGASVLINGNWTVNGLITFELGHLLTGGNTVTLASTGSISGETAGKYLMGSLATTRTVGTNASTFGNIGLEINSGADDLGEVAVVRNTNAGAFTNNNGESIFRNWEITAENQPSNGRDLTFTWNSGDNNPNVDLTSAAVFKSSNDESSWENVSGFQDASSGTITAENISSFSVFTVAGENFGLSNAPVLSNIEEESLTFIENDDPIQITSSILLNHEENGIINNAEITISNNFVIDEDSLVFSPTASITGEWLSEEGKLLLSGTDTITNYQSALRSISYNNSASVISTLPRRITFSVSDGLNSSNEVSRDINFKLIKPTGLTAEVESGVINLKWEDNSTSELGYSIERAVAEGEFTIEAKVSANETFFSDPNIENEVVYRYRVQAFDEIVTSDYSNVVEATGLVTSVSQPSDLIPNEYTLKQNYPNPFNNTSQIRFGLPEKSFVEINVYNLLGQKLDVLTRNDFSAGFHNVVWNAINYASGIYYYSIKAVSKNEGKEYFSIKKMIYLK